MAKQTQGEWGVCLIDGGTEDDEIVTQVNGCFVNIAAVFGEGEYSEARPNGEEEPNYKVSKEEAAANALLLSAAPDLLAALIDVRDNVLNDSPEMWERVDAAIAKATGQ